MLFGPRDRPVPIAFYYVVQPLQLINQSGPALNMEFALRPFRNGVWRPFCYRPEHTPQHIQGLKLYNPESRIPEFSTRVRNSRLESSPIWNLSLVFFRFQVLIAESWNANFFAWNPKRWFPMIHEYVVNQLDEYNHIQVIPDLPVDSLGCGHLEVWGR